MGRSRKPLSAQTQCITRADKERRKLEEKAIETGKDQLLTPPDWLTNVRAVKEWKRITRELLRLDVIGNLDIDALGCYCNALAAYIETTKELEGQPILVEKELSSGAIQMVPNPLYEAQRQHATEMRRFGALCGITLDSRLKAAAIKTAKVEDEITQEFGVI